MVVVEMSIKRNLLGSDLLADYDHHSIVFDILVYPSENEKSPKEPN